MRLKKKIEYLLFPCQKKLDEAKDDFKNAVYLLCAELEDHKEKTLSVIRKP